MFFTTNTSLKNVDIPYNIADYESRSINSQVLVLIREHIKAFEQSNGPISDSILPDTNVKPAGK